jgi:hypothetical protein
MVVRTSPTNIKTLGSMAGISTLASAATRRNPLQRLTTVAVSARAMTQSSSQFRIVRVGQAVQPIINWLCDHLL